MTYRIQPFNRISRGEEYLAACCKFVIQSPVLTPGFAPLKIATQSTHYLLYIDSQVMLDAYGGGKDE
jgi:hypothetical protein